MQHAVDARPPPPPPNQKAWGQGYGHLSLVSAIKSDQEVQQKAANKYYESIGTGHTDSTVCACNTCKQKTKKTELLYNEVPKLAVQKVRHGTIEDT